MIALKRSSVLTIHLLFQCDVLPVTNFIAHTYIQYCMYNKPAQFGGVCTGSVSCTGLCWHDCAYGIHRLRKLCAYLHFHSHLITPAQDYIRTHSDISVCSELILMSIYGHSSSWRRPTWLKHPASDDSATYVRTCSSRSIHHLSQRSNESLQYHIW